MNPFSSFTSVVSPTAVPAGNEAVVGEVSEVSVTPTPSCADARSDVKEASEKMSRETKLTKTREATHRFGIAEPSIGILLKVSFCKTLILTCPQQCSRAQFFINVVRPRKHSLRHKTRVHRD